MQKFFIFMVSNLVLLSSCYGNESDPRQRKIRRAVEFVGTEFQPGPDCVFKGSVSMPAQDLEPLGGETGGVEADFFHDLTGKALRMEAPYRGLFPSPPLFDRMPTYRTQGKRSLNFLSAGYLRFGGTNGALEFGPGGARTVARSWGLIPLPVPYLAQPHLSGPAQPRSPSVHTTP